VASLFLPLCASADEGKRSWEGAQFLVETTCVSLPNLIAAGDLKNLEAEVVTTRDDGKVSREGGPGWGCQAGKVEGREKGRATMCAHDWLNLRALPPLLSSAMSTHKWAPRQTFATSSPWVLDAAGLPTALCPERPLARAPIRGRARDNVCATCTRHMHTPRARLARVAAIRHEDLIQAPRQTFATSSPWVLDAAGLPTALCPERPLARAPTRGRARDNVCATLAHSVMHPCTSCVRACAPWCPRAQEACRGWCAMVPSRPGSMQGMVRPRGGLLWGASPAPRQLASAQLSSCPAAAAAATVQVMVRPKVEGFNEAVDFEADELRKLFKVGAGADRRQSAVVDEAAQAAQAGRSAHMGHGALAGRALRRVAGA